MNFLEFLRNLRSRDLMTRLVFDMTYFYIFFSNLELTHANYFKIKLGGLLTKYALTIMPPKTW